jgi:hypothetical protein
LGRGQEKGAARIGNTGKPFDEPTTQKTPGPSGWVAAGARGVAALERIAYTPFARLLADHLAAPQRSRFNLAPACSQALWRPRQGARPQAGTRPKLFRNETHLPRGPDVAHLF